MILVTGATGNVGRPLVKALRDSGAEVRAMTRDPAAARLGEGVDVVWADPSRLDTVADLLDGVTSVFVNSAALGDSVGDFAELARERGVRRLVGLSAFNIEQDRSLQPSRFFGHRNAETEAAVESSGLEWVSLRPAVFAGPAHVVLWGPQLAVGDVVTGPYADFVETLVDPRDVAEVAAHALLTDDLLGRKPVLTGPDYLSHAELVTILGKVLDRPLRYREIGLEPAAELIAASGLPSAMVASLIARYAVFNGRPPQPSITHEVPDILGRPARSFERWARDHAAVFGN
ncbi:NAD(P)H-binding protein [Stackebrandtia nassauensis]|uniref:NmrA family protein n=1 Tax=Stackebrandtia nassauensis (strain DSM 44728 / CIP 108903 / NRRL B-16338 / NBRC 102104 / LLR-40K-21) TaxID=446470 RepID=D3PX18_STANL|nr:NAD(P)H-binding protein [Stackebrandtia nassauensis]ADD45242.1 NmrA family protein [Stackebrandtia nassauensis DSM 44728]